MTCLLSKGRVLGKLGKTIGMIPTIAKAAEGTFSMLEPNDRQLPDPSLGRPTRANRSPILELTPFIWACV